MTYSGKRFNAVANFGHGTNDLFWFVLPLVLPLMLRTFGLNYSQAGGILTLYLFIIAVLSFVFGKLSDRISRWTLLGPGFFTASAALILSGFMPNLPLLITCIIITAIGVSTFHPVMYAAVDERSPLEKGVAFGKYEFWGSAAIFAMYAIYGSIMRTVGWQLLLVITALPGIIAGIIYSIGRPEPPAPSPVPEREEAESGPPLPSWVFTVFLLSILLRILGITATNNFIPTYLTIEVGMSSSLATYGMGLFFLGAALASIPAGKLADRWGAFPTIGAAIVLMLPSIFILSIDVPYWLYAIVLFLFGAGFGAGHPAHNMIATRLTKRLGSGETFGILMAMMTIVSALSPILQGMLADRIGLGMAFIIFEIPLLASLVLTIILMKSERVYVRQAA